MTTLLSPLKSLQVGPGIVLAKAVGGNVPSVVTPVEFEGLQSVGLDIDTKIVSASGQLMMPFDSAPVDRTIKGTIEMLALNGTLFSNIISGDTPTSGGDAGSYREMFTLATEAVAARASSNAYTVGEVYNSGGFIYIVKTAGISAASAPAFVNTLGTSTIDGTAVVVCAAADTGTPANVCIALVSQSADFSEDLGVMYTADNVQLATLGGAQGDTPPDPPAVGQYVAVGTTGYYLFNATDAVDVFITYLYTSSILVNSFPLINHWIGWGPICEINIQFPYQSVQGGSTRAIIVALHLLAVRFGSQKIKTKRDGYATVTYDFEAFCPPGGEAGQFYLPN